jgi:hypothetical protein
MRTSVQDKPIAGYSKSLPDELKQLVELRSSGLLTEEEFEKAKTKLLEG